jgi:hypothetical protein
MNNPLELIKIVFYPLTAALEDREKKERGGG